MGVTNTGLSAQQVRKRTNKARRTGRWPRWQKHAVSVSSKGWASEFSTAYENGVFCVLVRPVHTEWGEVQHAMINTAFGIKDITWAEKQRIKDEVFGSELTAVEVFPSSRQIVDAADAYHLWVLPAEFQLPFTLKTALEAA